MTGRRRLVAVAVAITAAVAATTVASASIAGASDWRGSNSLRVELTGFQEVPAISTSGTGEFRALIDERRQRITWELSYADLETGVTQAHIHIEQRSNNGLIVVFFCTNLGNGPAGTPACPPAPATITGTIEPDDVGGGAAAQGIAAGEFDELVAAIRANTTYVNVHSTFRTGGEIRAQLGDDHRH
jgi:hypothetical protein